MNVVNFPPPEELNRAARAIGSGSDRRTDGARRHRGDYLVLTLGCLAVAAFIFWSLE